MARSHRRASTLLVAVAVAMCAASAHAQPNDKKAQAEALFDEGKKLVGAGKTAEACPKFEESLRAAVGLGTMLWLADCYESVGRTASAWAEFREAAAFASERHDPREKVARKRAATLEPKLSKLVIVVPAAHASGLEVKRDGEPVAAGAWGTEVPVDPGEHTIAASAPARSPWTTTVRIEAKAGLTRVTVAELAPAPVADTPPPPPDRRPETPPPPPDKPAGGLSTQATIGIVVGATGVAGLVVGTVFGLIAKSQYNKANSSDCNADGVCNAKGLQGRVDALNSATISTIGFVAGGVLAAGGAVLYFTAPSPSRTGSVGVSPVVASSSAGAALVGAW